MLYIRDLLKKKKLDETIKNIILFIYYRIFLLSTYCVSI